MQYKRLKLDIDGLLLIDKSHGLSSNQIVSKIKEKGAQDILVMPIENIIS